MALQLSYDAPTGVTHSSAYHKITSLRHDRYGGTMSIHVSIYKDSTAKTNDKSAVGYAVHTVSSADHDTYFANSVVDTVDQNTVERSYVYLKTLDDYSGATDV
jgi:hypothetical protein